MSYEMTWIASGLVALNLLSLGIWVASFRPRFVIGASGEARTETAGARAETAQRAQKDDGVDGPAHLEDWIDEIEGVESQQEAADEGSEDWWRAWAESGGSLPSVADSGRPAPKSATNRLSSVG